MSEQFKKRMDELKEHTKINHFQHEQLLYLNTMMDSLISIADSLKTINYGLSEIFKRRGISKKGSPKTRWIDEEENEEEN